MRVLTKSHLLRSRPLAPARRRHDVGAAPARPLDELGRARRAPGPQDTALYRCHCGYSFEAAVTASVSCPRCGDSQAW